MRMKSAERVAFVPRFQPPFHNGDRMDQPTFHALYEKTPPGFKAELIGGYVHLPSPTSYRHGAPHARVVHWLSLYMGETPGTDVVDNTTNILGEEDEPQPDACLFIAPESNGQTTVNEDGYLVGPCELVVEVANSSYSIDMNAKKRQYEAAGVREYLVVVVQDKEAVWFARGRRGFSELPSHSDGVMRSKVFPGLWLTPDTLFERSTRRLLTTVRAGLATPEHAAFVAKLEAKARKVKPARPAEDES